ncbi:transposase, partial [Marinimicrococcus flavescens]|nr:transposase [Marinimicrococcus flavescens]
MARIARAVAPGVPHHVTQRGNRRQRTFFDSSDYAVYKSVLAEECAARGVAVWGWCLMPNHVHLVLVPPAAPDLAAAVGETHRRYTTHVNQREGWRGHLWQGRFGSCALDERHLLAALRYVELNPVRARLAETPQAWPWSSARARLQGAWDGLIASAGLEALVGDWREFLALEPAAATMEALRAAERSGRPLGSAAFVSALEHSLGRCLRPHRAGR